VITLYIQTEGNSSVARKAINIDDVVPSVYTHTHTHTHFTAQLYKTWTAGLR